MEYVKLKMSVFFRRTSGMTDAECGRFVRETFEAVDDDRHGVNAWADALLDEVEAYIGTKREAGRRGGQAKARNARSLAEPSSATPKPSTATETASTARDATEPPSTPLAVLDSALANPSSATKKPSSALAKPSTPLATPTHNITEHNIKDSNTTKVITPITRARARTREDGQAESERDWNRNRNQDPDEQSTIPARIAATRPLEAVVGATLAATSPPPKPAPQATPAAKAEPSKPTAPSAPSKPAPPGKSGPFSWADLSEDKQRYVWTIAPALLPQFAVWFCQEPENAKAKAVYEKFCARFGAEPFRILLDKFVASVFAGEEPDNRGAAFMATVMAEGRERQAELAKTGNKSNQTTNKQNQNKGENK